MNTKMKATALLLVGCLALVAPFRLTPTTPQRPPPKQAKEYGWSG